MDQTVLQALQTITGSAITVLIGDTILSSTWPVAVHPALATSLAAAGWATATPLLRHTTHDVQALPVGGETYLSLAMPLVDPQQQPVGVTILQKSLDQELAPLHHLRRTLLGTGVMALVLALEGSFLIARGVTAPVQALVQGAVAVGRRGTISTGWRCVDAMS